MLRIRGESILFERASTLWMLPSADRRGALIRAKGTIHSPLLGTETAGLKQRTNITPSPSNKKSASPSINDQYHNRLQAVGIVFHVEGLLEAMSWS